MLAAGQFLESIAHGLRDLLRVAHSLKPQPSAATFDGRTLQPIAESGARAYRDGAKKRDGIQLYLCASYANRVANDSLANLVNNRGYIAFEKGGKLSCFA